jgi:prepilin-type N-terminal cleavage/methylation domain-containing protein
MQRNKNTGFSLIELMIVIGIIGILATMALPSYRSYVVKSKLANAISIMQAARDAAIAAYNETGSYPATLSVPGGNINLNTSLGIAGKDALSYNVQGGNLIFCYSTANLGFDGSTNPVVNGTAVGNPGNQNTICTQTTLNNNLYTTNCGNWTPNDSRALPPAYLPGGCNCASVSTGSC